MQRKNKLWNTRAHVRGIFGEELCTHLLIKRGYEIIERNYKVPQGEVDIICSKEGYLVFVEVKTWARFSVPDIAYSVNEKKLLRVRACAALFIEIVGVEKLHTRMCVRCDVMLCDLSRRMIVHYKGVE